MKTTLDLPDDLLIEAKAMAARRRITLKDMVTHALRREIMPSNEGNVDDSKTYELGPFGMLRLRKRNTSITDHDIKKLSTEADDDEFRKAIQTRSNS